MFSRIFFSFSLFLVRALITWPTLTTFAKHSIPYHNFAIHSIPYHNHNHNHNTIVDNDPCHGEDVTCLKQSPIDISNAIFNPSLQPLQVNFQRYNINKDTNLDEETKSKSSFQCTDNGHSFQCNVNQKQQNYYLKYQQWNYTLAQLHFHWNTQHKTGSEHTINGEQKPVEMHMVYYKSTFNNFNEALSDNTFSNLLVVGVMIDATPYHFNQNNGNKNGNNNVNKHQFDGLIHKVSKAAKKANYKGSTIDTDLDVLAVFNDGNGLSDYYSYEGSLTTPGYNEIVQWVILKETKIIQERHINNLYKLIDEKEEVIRHNFRNTQPLYGRKVYQ
eukprot:Pgem_evm1s3703